MDSTLVSKNDPSGVGASNFWRHLFSVERRYAVPGATRLRIGDADLFVVMTEKHGSERVGVHVEQWDEAVEAWRKLPESEQSWDNFLEARRAAESTWLGLAQTRGWKEPA